MGIYGVIAYAVAQQAREIDIRIALGAPARDVRRMFVRRGAMLASIGVVVGLASAIALTRLMSSLLFGVSPLDPATYLGVSLALIVPASLASYVPGAQSRGCGPRNLLRG
jgi:putative ABC transport system permease protein